MVDSGNLSVGHGALVLAAAEAAEAGRSVSEILAMAEDMVSRIETSFVLDRLDYMKKGGRCSAVTALGANLLKLHPCLEVIDGKLSVVKKYRGSMEKVYRQYITERLAGKSVVEDWAFITHSGEVSEQTLQELTELVKTLAPFKEVFVTQAGCTVSSHCGPGTLGVLFLRQPEQWGRRQQREEPRGTFFPTKGARAGILSAGSGCKLLFCLHAITRPFRPYHG